MPLQYGNETSLTYGYSSLAIIAQIPPYAEREFVDDKAGSEEDKEDDEGDSTDEMSR